MPKRSHIFVSLLIASVILVFGWPIFTIHRNLKQGERIKDVLLSSLRSRYPERVFRGGVGYEGPRVVIEVMGPASPEERAAIRELLAAERDKAALGAEIWLEFEGDENTAEARQKI